MPAGILTQVSPPSSDSENELATDTDHATAYPTEDSENVGVTPLSMNRYFRSNPYPQVDPRWKSNTWATQEHADALAREQQEVRDYLAENPCMTYDEVNAEMLRYCVTQPAVMSWMAEFGEWNYEHCKTMREHILDYNVSKEIGQKIYDRGGFNALQANFYVMKNFMCRGCLRFQVTEYMFDQVGQGDDRWQA